MRLFRFFIFLTLFCSLLEASYIRSIRLQSYQTDESAKDAILDLERFAQKHPRILELKDKFDFEFKDVKVGQYYVLCIEPVRNKDAVRELLEIVRLKYKDAYPRKIKDKYKKKQTIVRVERHDITVQDAKDEQNIPDEPTSESKETSSENVFNTAKDTDVQINKDLKEASLNGDIAIERENTNISQDIVKTSHNKGLDAQVQTVENTNVSSYVQNGRDILFWTLGAIVAALLIGLLFLIRRYRRLKEENESYISKDLIQSEKLIQLNSQMKYKDRILSHVSHELRTPMTAIMGLTHLVLESDLPQQQKEYVEKIDKSAENMLNIINDILDLSKIQAGKLKIENTEFNINDILEYVLNTISIKAMHNNLNISMDIDSNVPSHIMGDSFRLGQVLINLMSNSVKFTKDGEVTLKVEKIDGYGDNVKLRFVISDTGIGMSESQVENIFDSYHQADISTSREFGGTGLGLAISKQLVEMMRGDIIVKSKKDVGTTFIVTINFKLKDSQNKRQYRLPSASLLNKKILIVDKSNKNVLSLIKSLGYFHYKTHSIPSFEEAILEHGMVFDIIIVNQANLSKLAIKKIKAMQEKDNSKVVVLSELYSLISVKSLDGLKINAYLKVPFTQQKILNMITELYVEKNLDKRSRRKKPKEKLRELAPKKILIAEDNELNHKVIAGLLAHTKFELVFVTNGQELLSILHRGVGFDLILMDINMPVLNGYETALEIRRNKKYTNLPIIALSADVKRESIDKALECGMQDYITKPIIVDTFYKKILDALSKKISIQNKEVGISEEGYESLSVSVGLSRCDGDERFYRQILNDFRISYVDSASRLEQMCKALKLREARTLAMDIKDVALNIGAYKLGESAATMEYKFEKASSSGKCVSLISNFKVELEKLLREIDSYLTLK